MKTKNTILHLMCTGLFSYLFYEQGNGANILVFTTAMILFLALNSSTTIRSWRWTCSVILYLITGITAAYNASALNVILNLLSMLVFGYHCLNQHQLSVISGGIYAGFTMASGFFFGLVQKLTNYTTNDKPNIPKPAYKWWYFILPAFVFVTFFVLYRNSSEAFADLTNQIDLSFISPFWVAFTLMGYVLLFGFFYTINGLPFWFGETKVNNQLKPESTGEHFSFYGIGVILFYSLNVLLLVVVVSDTIYLSSNLPANRSLTYSEMIHQGVAALICSIVLAIGFIMVWFHKKNNHMHQYKHLRVGAFIWMVLNALLIVCNVYKNWLYIDAHGYTYKRVGVYFALFLSLVVILICLYKILNEKNNWFMYRSFGISLLLVGLGFNTFNWDKIIVTTNIRLYSAGKIKPDVQYILDLSSDCLPVIHKNWSLINQDNNVELNKKFDYKVARFIQHFEEADWRSKAFKDYDTYNQLKRVTALSGLTKAELFENFEAYRNVW